jgi:hypothetical protein
MACGSANIGVERAARAVTGFEPGAAPGARGARVDREGYGAMTSGAASPRMRRTLARLAA